ncbi:hypothetical protein PHET_03863 [Paragonimus heterotremus]|uniref:Uncharacterized protein n=1 Tax=Paragonimus heterotremus TaxID=100268 RepID=A0A8J4SQU9_9TREM|nr:hypothetical protein PHET_03863 [Paragonimus heterotremus]
MAKLSALNKAKPRCTAVLPTLFSPVDGQNGDPFAQTPELFHPLLLLERFCYNLTVLGKHSANITYRLIDRIYETIINHRLPGSEKISSQDAVHYLGRLMDVASSIFRTTQESLPSFRNRTRYFTFEKFHLQKYSRLEFNDCGNMKVIFPWGTGSVFVACVPYGEPLHANSFREKQLLLGVTLVQGDPEQFRVEVEFTLPPPHVFTRYECVWAEKLEIGKFRTPHLYDKRAIITEPKDICFFDRPGYYAVMSVGKFFREEEFNPVRTNRLLWGHLLLILLSLAALVFNLVIDFNSTCMFIYARGAKNLRQIRCYILLACQVLFITACKLMVQLVGIFVPERRYCETVGLFQLGIHAVFHALNLVVSVLVFSIRRSHSPVSLMVKFSACAYVFGLLYTLIASFYLKRQFVKLNCMPLQMFKLMAYPFIGISLGSLPFILRFLCSPPYRHWDEWVGAILQTMAAITPWIEAIITRSELSWHGYSEYHFVLLMLIQALVLVVYYGLLKYSILLLIVKGICGHVSCSKENRTPTSSRLPGLTHSESDSNSEPQNFISQLLDADQRQWNSQGTDSSTTTVSQSRSLNPSINLDIDETGHGAREIEFSTVAFPRSRFMSSMKKLTPTHHSLGQEPSVGWLSAPPEDTDLTLPLVNEVIPAERKSSRGRRKIGRMRHSAGRLRYYRKSVG